MDNTIEFLGTTTYRVRSNGLTIFLDTYIDRPSATPGPFPIESITEADYIFISHAHFDHLPGCDRIALQTGAQVVGSCEVIRLMREAGVPERQLIPVAGGERIPLFNRATWEAALKGECKQRDNFPDAPREPHHSLAVSAVDVWPSLHAMIIDHDTPEVWDTASVTPSVEDRPYACTLDITRGMRYGLLQLDKLVPPEKRDARMQSFIDFVKDPKNVLSHCDGGQLMYNFRFFDSGKVMLWNAHLGGYEGILRNLEPKPDLAILGIPGNANLNGRPFKGSGAQFLKLECEWLGNPERVSWCLHDETPIKPYRVDATAATRMVEAETRSKVWELEPTKVYPLF